MNHSNLFSSEGNNVQGVLRQDDNHHHNNHESLQTQRQQKPRHIDCVLPTVGAASNISKTKNSDIGVNAGCLLDEEKLSAKVSIARAFMSKSSASLPPRAKTFLGSSASKSEAILAPIAAAAARKEDSENSSSASEGSASSKLSSSTSASNKKMKGKKKAAAMTLSKAVKSSIKAKQSKQWRKETAKKALQASAATTTTAFNCGVLAGSGLSHPSLFASTIATTVLPAPNALLSASAPSTEPTPLGALSSGSSSLATVGGATANATTTATLDYASCVSGVEEAVIQLNNIGVALIKRGQFRDALKVLRTTFCTWKSLKSPELYEAQVRRQQVNLGLLFNAADIANHASSTFPMATEPQAGKPQGDAINALQISMMLHSTRQKVREAQQLFLQNRNQGGGQQDHGETLSSNFDAMSFDDTATITVANGKLLFQIQPISTASIDFSNGTDALQQHSDTRSNMSMVGSPTDAGNDSTSHSNTSSQPRVLFFYPMQFAPSRTTTTQSNQAQNEEEEASHDSQGSSTKVATFAAYIGLDETTSDEESMIGLFSSMIMLNVGIASLCFSVKQQSDFSFNSNRTSPSLSSSSTNTNQTKTSSPVTRVGDANRVSRRIARQGSQIFQLACIILEKHVSLSVLELGADDHDINNNNNNTVNSLGNGAVGQGQKAAINVRRQRHMMFASRILHTKLNVLQTLAQLWTLTIKSTSPRESRIALIAVHEKILRVRNALLILRSRMEL